MNQDSQGVEQLESRKVALERVLRATLHLPAQVTFYGFALGAIVLLGGGGLPAALAPIASSLGGNILASILERVARGEDVALEELQQAVQNAITHSGDIAQLLKTDQQNQVQLAHVIRKLNLIRTLQQQGTYDILRRIDGQSTSFVELRHELHAEFSGIQKQLESISERQELQATKEDLDHHTEL